MCMKLIKLVWVSALLRNAFVMLLYMVRDFKGLMTIIHRVSLTSCQHEGIVHSELLPEMPSKNVGAWPWIEVICHGDLTRVQGCTMLIICVISVSVLLYFYLPWSIIRSGYLTYLSYRSEIAIAMQQLCMFEYSLEFPIGMIRICWMFKRLLLNTYS